MLNFIKNWTLLIAITAGIIAYLAYANCSLFGVVRPFAAPAVAVIQPLLIFSMLFLSFCKIDIRQLRPRLPHLWLLLIQCGSFALLSLLLYFFPRIPGRVLAEGAMLCLICPTATAAAVVTQKLKGDAADVTMYTILANVAVAIVVPLLIPLTHPQAGQSFFQSFFLILGKVFPILICPLLAAQLVRIAWPRLHKKLVSYRDLAFYLWAVSLSIAIAVTVRSIAHTTHPVSELVGIAAVSLVCCAVQFGIGRIIGKHYAHPISTCQALGQKNTVFGIWLGYTFLNPVTSIAGGFYCIWHNVYNTWQLRKERKHEMQTGNS